jgi:hypothetical protein
MRRSGFCWRATSAACGNFFKARVRAGAVTGCIRRWTRVTCCTCRALSYAAREELAGNIAETPRCERLAPRRAAVNANGSIASALQSSSRLHSKIFRPRKERRSARRLWTCSSMIHSATESSCSNLLRIQRRNSENLVDLHRPAALICGVTENRRYVGQTVDAFHR